MQKHRFQSQAELTSKSEACPCIEPTANHPLKSSLGVKAATMFPAATTKAAEGISAQLHGKNAATKRLLPFAHLSCRGRGPRWRRGARVRARRGGRRRAGSRRTWGCARGAKHGRVAADRKNRAFTILAIDCALLLRSLTPHAATSQSASWIARNRTCTQTVRSLYPLTLPQNSMHLESTAGSRNSCLLVHFCGSPFPDRWARSDSSYDGALIENTETMRIQSVFV